ncbi:hypothetical protein [Parapedobacter sp. 10938]|uniref:hypothetical protein n=1 Tax=Parapedobacter flavus TaxID=3110225 RepID=UPI002DB9BB33|nr:hypothetical protein [Parapedobacter sp. 10938]MEC3880661.1 hypothetical protein [Parapedobacter sp. 10938]
MYTLTAFLFLVGFHLCYRKPKTVISKWGAVLAFLVGWMLLVFTMGWGAGSFAVLAYAMCTGSLVVLLAPFGFMRGRQLMVLAAVSLLLEFLIRS